jgi:hypothetical protein
MMTAEKPREQISFGLRFPFYQRVIEIDGISGVIVSGAEYDDGTADIYIYRAEASPSYLWLEGLPMVDVENCLAPLAEETPDEEPLEF